MKNPTEPNFKTEWFPILTIMLSLLAAFYFSSYLPHDLILSWTEAGEPDQSISWTMLAYLWPMALAAVYMMFLFFPYFKINHQESAALKEQWHKAKELSLAFFFSLQVVGGLMLLGRDRILIWALPVLFFLFLISLIPTIARVARHRKNHPIKRW
ncbi:MAG: hypothetical protein WCK59_03715 [Candidatus Falkowbacteria bacterium]